MKLRNQGAIQPAPALQGAAGEMIRRLQQWQGVGAFTHWRLGDSRRVDGAELHVDDMELGHIHLDGDIHLLLNKKLGRSLVQKGHASSVPWGDEWVKSTVRDESDLEHGLWLFQLGYDRLRNVGTQELLVRISETR